MLVVKANVDLGKFVDRMVDIYHKNGSLGVYAQLFNDNGASVVKAIENTGKTNNNEIKFTLFKGNVFPPYNKSQSDANERATRWAHNEDVDNGARRIIGYHGQLFLIEKYESLDLGYQIVERLTKEEYGYWSKKREAINSEKNKTKQSRREKTDSIGDESGLSPEYRGIELGSDMYTDEYRGETGSAGTVDRVEDGRRASEYQRDRTDEHGIENRENEIKESDNYEYSGIVQGRDIRDGGNLGRGTGEHSSEYGEGIQRGTGRTEKTAYAGRTTKRELNGVKYNEISNDDWSGEMSSLARENTDKYGIETVYFSGEAINEAGDTADAFYYDGVLYLQVDGKHDIRTLRDHEVTHHAEGTEAHQIFKDSVKNKLGTKRYFYVFYKGEDGRVAPIFRMDYKYIDLYVNEVRNISRELGYDENEFIFEAQEIRSEHEEIRRERTNIGTDANASPDGGGSGQGSGFRSGARGGNGGKSTGESRFSEQLDSGLPDGGIVGKRNEIPSKGRRDGRLSTSKKDAQTIANDNKDVRFNLSDGNGDVNNNDGGYENGFGEENSSKELGWLGDSSETKAFGQVGEVGRIQQETPNTPHTRRIHRNGISARILTSSGLTAEQAALKQQNKIEGVDTEFYVNAKEDGVEQSDLFHTENTIYYPNSGFEREDILIKNGTASFTKKRFSELIEEYSVPLGGQLNGDYSKAYVAYISPDDFLRLTTINKELIELDSERYGTLDVEKLRNNNVRTDGPYLEIDFEDGRVYDHNGRHRMVLLRNAGINRVAIIVRDVSSERNKYKTEKHSNVTLLGQKFDSGESAPGKVVIDEIIPLSPNYRREVKQKFVDNNADIRYSLSSSDSYSTQKIIEAKALASDDSEFIEAAKENTKQVQSYVRSNKDLQKRLENAKRQMTRSKAPRVNVNEVAKVTKQIISDLQGTVKAAELKDEENRKAGYAFFAYPAIFKLSV